MDFQFQLHFDSSIKYGWILYLSILFTVSLQASLLNLEEWMEQSDNEEQLAIITEELDVWKNNFLNLNTISLTLLKDFPLLSQTQAKTIIKIRKTEGPFKSWIDFKKKSGWTNQDVEIFSNYFSLNNTPQSNRQTLHLRQRFYHSYPLSRGYIEKKFEGSPIKSEQRIAYKYSPRMNGRFLIQKDAGEKKWNDHQRGFIEIHPSKWIDKLIIGNYYLQFGHGLVLSAPYRRSPSLQLVQFMQMPNQTIHGFSSASENSGCAGLAIQSSAGRFKSSLFISKLNRDAKVYDESSIQSMDMSGLHRTSSEILKSNTVSESMQGLRLSWHSSILHLGLTAWQNNTSIPFEYDDPATYYYHFKGSKNHVIGIDWNLYMKPLILSGEYAQSRSGGHGIQQSISNDSKSVKWSLGFRAFTPDFQNPYGQAGLQNLQSFYLAASWNFNRRIKTGFYVNHVIYPWRTYINPLPSQNQHWMFQLNWRCLPKTNLKLRIRKNTKEAFRTVNNIWQIPEANTFNIIEKGFRIELQGGIAKHIDYKLRMEQKTYSKENFEKHQGWICFYQIKYGNRKTWQCILRWTSYETDTYDSRLYTYEPDLPGVFQISPFYLSGTSTLIVIHFQARKFLSLHVKYKTIYHDNVESWGSGNNQINNNQIHHVGFQMDIQI